MKYRIPTHFLAYFEAEALKSVDKDGKVIETLAIGLGKKEDDSIFMNELIFPSQEASDSHVEDTGKYFKMLTTLKDKTQIRHSFILFRNFGPRIIFVDIKQLIRIPKR